MKVVPSFLRPIAILAGIAGITQSVIWIAISIASIVAYYCHLDFTGVTNTMGTITGITLFELYFKASSCSPMPYPNIDVSPLEELTLMRPVDIHAWSWVYLMMSFFWFISSCTLLTNVKAKYIRWANVFLYIWIGITLSIAVIDLVLGILFGLDYNIVMVAAQDVPFVLTDLQSQGSHILIAAQAAIGTMFSVVFRGYVVWLFNLVLVIYLFTQTLLVSDYNRIMGGAPKQGVSNGGFINDNRHPIEAFGAKDSPNLWYNGTSPAAAEQNHSRSVFEERKQFYNSIQPIRASSQPSSANNHQLIHPSNRTHADHEVQLRQSNVVRELNKRQSQKPAVPEPDYSPPMPRVNPFDLHRNPKPNPRLGASHF